MILSSLKQQISAYGPPSEYTRRNTTNNRTYRQTQSTHNSHTDNAQQNQTNTDTAESAETLDVLVQQLTNVHAQMHHSLSVLFAERMHTLLTYLQNEAHTIAEELRVLQKNTEEAEETFTQWKTQKTLSHREHSQKEQKSEKKDKKDDDDTHSTSEDENNTNTHTEKDKKYPSEAAKKAGLALVSTGPDRSKSPSAPNTADTPTHKTIKTVYFSFSSCFCFY